jgi:hypothetical protein
VSRRTRRRTSAPSSASAWRSITVTADAPIVETRRATVAEEITLEEVQALPASRDYSGCAQLVAGVNIVPNQGGA